MKNIKRSITVRDHRKGHYAEAFVITKMINTTVYHIGDSLPAEKIAILIEEGYTITIIK